MFRYASNLLTIIVTYIAKNLINSHVQSQLERLRSRYDKFQDVVFNSNTSGNSEFSDLRKGKNFIIVHDIAKIISFRKLIL